MKIVAITTAFALFAAMSGATAADEDDRPISVSLIRLIAAPKEYSGKQVQISGYLHLEFEGNGIYLHREDSQYAQYKNGLWVEVSPENAKRLRAAADRYVVLTGTFDPDSHGHMGLWSGTMAKITHVQAWPPRSLDSKK